MLVRAPEDPLVGADAIEAYRRDGFVALRSVLTREEAARYADAALAASERLRSLRSDAVFAQHVNVWLQDETLRELTLHPRIAAIAGRLAGVPLRLWHDQLLIKTPHNERATEFHQDQPYWPHSGARAALSAWVALVDVPVERGCMTFIPGSQRLRDLAAQALEVEGDLFEHAPELRWAQRVTIPLRAGDLTFHDARCGHMATPNLTDEPRVAHAIIYVDAETTYSGAPHPVTDPLGLRAGARLEHELFPRVAR
jgi:ectoine hydroxylase-related dioxygenase (phytanoyl-CoA dioxygenase family)